MVSKPASIDDIRSLADGWESAQLERDMLNLMKEAKRPERRADFRKFALKVAAAIRLYPDLFGPTITEIAAERISDICLATLEVAQG
jgi:hypothetical protein